jgi:Zn-dependent protease
VESNTAYGGLTPPDAAPSTASPGAQPPTQYPESYRPEPAQRKPPWRRLLAALAAIGLLVVKFGAKLKGLLLLLPKVKFLTTSASALVSVAAYSLIWTWKFALGFVVLLFIHEMGHVLQLRREGIKATAPMFIPFLGAAVGMKELPKDAAAEARVGLAGPVLGALGCLIPVGLFVLTGDELFQALAYIGFFLNLFNLAPVLPLDGGRAMAALSPWMWVVGWLMLIALMIFFPNPIILLIALLGGIETYRRWKNRKTPEAQRYNRVRPRTRAAVAAVYLGLAVLLALGMDATYLERTLSDV